MRGAKTSPTNPVMIAVVLGFIAYLVHGLLTTPVETLLALVTVAVVAYLLSRMLVYFGGANA